MNPYEYETTLDCRDDTRTIGGGGGGGVMIGGITGPMTPRHPHGSQQNTLHHQNQQNFQLQQQPQQQQQQQQQDAQSSTYYDYEYQHLPHRANDLNPTAPTATPSAASTAARTHGRQGFLLEGVTPTAPPDVPPRNPTMNRMNNGRLVAANPNDLGVDFEPSCLVRTPSGNVYIPSDNLNINKGSPIDYKSGSACSTPTKDTLKGYERSTNNCMGPVLPPRSVMSGIPTHHYSAPMNFRKDLAARCSAKCVAIVSVTIFVAMCVLLIFLTGFGVLHWSPSAPCTVLVGNEASEVTAAKSTNTDLSKLHNYAPRSKTGQSTTLVTTVSSSLPSSSSASAAASSSSSAFQSTSASSVAVGAAAATSSATSSLSSSLANANNPESTESLMRWMMMYDYKYIKELLYEEHLRQRQQQQQHQQQEHWQQQQQRQRERQRQRRSLSTQSFSDLITDRMKEFGVNKKDFTINTTTIYSENSTDMMRKHREIAKIAEVVENENQTKETENENKADVKVDVDAYVDADDDDAEDEFSLMMKSNYGNANANINIKADVKGEFEDITATKKLLPDFNFKRENGYNSSSSSIASDNLIVDNDYDESDNNDNDDKTLKINNILNLNKSNHYDNNNNNNNNNNNSNSNSNKNNF